MTRSRLIDKQGRLNYPKHVLRSGAFGPSEGSFLSVTFFSTQKYLILLNGWSSLAGKPKQYEPRRHDLTALDVLLLNIKKGFPDNFIQIVTTAGGIETLGVHHLSGFNGNQPLHSYSGTAWLS